MAELSYTFSQLKLAAQHAAAKSTFDSGNGADQIVNAALIFLAGYHRWEWRTTYATVSTVNADTSVDLPADFAELVEVSGNASPYLTKRFRRVPHRQMARIRQFATEVAANSRLNTTVFYAISGKVQSADTTLRTYQLEIHPAPTAVTNALRIIYLSMPPTLVDDSDKPDVPSDYCDLLLECVRAFATGREMIAQSGPNWERMRAMLDNQKAINDRMYPAIPELDFVVDDYHDVGKLTVAYAAFS